MITHDMRLMLDYSDRAVVVVDGQILADKAPAQVLTDQELIAAAHLKETSIFALAEKIGADPLALTEFICKKGGQACFNQRKLIGYHAGGETFLHGLSSASKMLFFVLVSVASMISYDTRFLLGLALLSLCLFRLSHIRIRDISFVLVFAASFAALNLVMVYLSRLSMVLISMEPKMVLWTGWGAYNLTAQQLFYLFNLLLKYVSTIPLAVIFPHDNPSQSVCFQPSSAWYFL